MLEIAVLVSVGRHPVSGRARRARPDAQALELGLGIAAATGARLRVWHAGSDEAEPALREYLGMGVDELRLVAVGAGMDPLPALAGRLGGTRPSLVLTGDRAEAGIASGYLPYALAAALDYSIVPAAVGLSVVADVVEVGQALPRGRRRLVHAALPALVTVDAAAPAPRPVAYARARRGAVVIERPAVGAAPLPDYGEARPARARPPRSRIAAGATAAERLQALTAAPTGQVRIVEPRSAVEGAREIVAMLAARGMIAAARGGANAPNVKR